MLYFVHKEEKKTSGKFYYLYLYDYDYKGHHSNHKKKLNENTKEEKMTTRFYYHFWDSFCQVREKINHESEMYLETRLSFFLKKPYISRQSKCLISAIYDEVLRCNVSM